MEITMDEAVAAWTGTLERVFPTRATEEKETVSSGVYDTKDIYICKNKVARPTVFIPVFPGTNCEYDSARAFERAGANTIVKVFKNLTASDIRDSVDEFVKAIGQSQIIMFPGGFSAGDEPEGSAKFFATAFRNAKMTEAVNKLLCERDGLALGICNGFQALIKLGLVPYGQIQMQTEDSPTLTYNTINRHISKMVYTKVVTNKSPWLQKATLGATYCNPASHGEGRFVAPKEMGWTSFCKSDRLQPSMSMKPESRPWMRNGMSMVPIWQSRESPARTEECWARWHTANAGARQLP